MAKQAETKIIAKNKKAFFDYEILDKYEAGLVLKGSEIKSARNGGVSLKEGYVKIIEGEAWLTQTRIAPYKQSGEYFNHDPFRDRKLLLHRREIDSIIGRVQRKGLTILPLYMYIKGNRAKLEIGLAKSKKKYDKKDDIIKRELDKEARREVKMRTRSQ